jgi:hypothetical protein
MTRTSSPILGLALLLGLAGGLTGCKSDAGPDWLHPGTQQAQQARALRYDPYPEPNIGPNVDGARPRDYDKPLAETQRARWQLGDWQQ